MRRVAMPPRSDWREKCVNVGFDFHTIDGATYWDESAAYAFSLEQIERIEAASEAVHALCLELVDWIVAGGHFEPYGLPAAAVDTITRAWRAGEPALYGRFDLAWDGVNGEPKVLEYNADTPTSLLEASVVQWFWLKDVLPEMDQFNSLHEQLIERWKALQLGDGPVHFTALRGNDEDAGNTGYLMDTACQAGLSVRYLPVEDIGLELASGRFVDTRGERIRVLQKLYPWEWLWDEEFGASIAHSGTRFIEPPWKILLSSKAMLPLLWARNRGHPNLLPASFTDTLGRPAVRKPLYSREGANIAMLRGDGVTVSSDGPYDTSRAIYQAYAPLPCFDGNYPVIGAWLIGESAAGIGIREDATPITRNSSRFVPHFICPD